MKVRSGVKAGGVAPNHNETLTREQARGMEAQTRVRAGGSLLTHNERLVRG